MSKFDSMMPPEQREAFDELLGVLATAVAALDEGFDAEEVAQYIHIIGRNVVAKCDSDDEDQYVGKRLQIRKEKKLR